jgi:glycosyltransferase involved in cell wall biosynthesis
LRIKLCRIFLLVRWIVEDRASVIFSSSSRHTWRKGLPICERPVGALDNYELESVCHRKNPNNFRILSVGRLLPWKGFDFGLKAFARLVEDRFEGEYCDYGGQNFQDHQLRVPSPLLHVGMPVRGIENSDI